MKNPTFTTDDDRWLPCWLAIRVLTISLSLPCKRRGSSVVRPAVPATRYVKMSASTPM